MKFAGKLHAHLLLNPIEPEELFCTRDMSLRALLDGITGQLGSVGQYVAFHRAFTAIPLLGPVTHFINAPFGRFSVASRFNVNGNLAWFLFEIISPIAFALSLLGGPLRSADATRTGVIQGPIWKVDASALDKLSHLTTPTKLLAVLYIVHYANRSTISSLRTPAPRAPIHPVVILAAAVFNTLNGTLMGTWLGGRTSHLTATTGAVPEAAIRTGFFWAGVALWTIGFVGNLISDEILYNLRKPGKDGKVKPRYSVPQGFLYSWPFGGISFPAYFCEWIEWLGFAIAACSYSPAPALPSLASIDPDEIILETARKLASVTAQTPQIENVLSRAGTYATPPFLFLFAEIATMVPRAFKGHQWYKRKFGSDFPKDRKVAIPGIF